MCTYAVACAGMEVWINILAGNDTYCKVEAPGQSHTIRIYGSDTAPLTYAVYTLPY